MIGIADAKHSYILKFKDLIGTFGINNMLITKIGCCGRYSSIVTNIDVEPDIPSDEEYCFYKKNGSCGICVKSCPSAAMT